MSCKIIIKSSHFLKTPTIIINTGAQMIHRSCQKKRRWRRPTVLSFSTRRISMQRMQRAWRKLGEICHVADTIRPILRLKCRRSIITECGRSKLCLFFSVCLRNAPSARLSKRLAFADGAIANLENSLPVRDCGGRYRLTQGLAAKTAHQNDWLE